MLERKDGAEAVSLQPCLPRDGRRARGRELSPTGCSIPALLPTPPCSHFYFTVRKMGVFDSLSRHEMGQTDRLLVGESLWGLCVPDP